MGELDTPITDLNKSLFDTSFALSLDQNTENSQQQLERHFVEPGVSHVVGDKRKPLIETTIPVFFSETVNKYSHLDAVAFPACGIRWSWRTLSEKIDALAAGLLAIGLKRGDRVGIWSPNRPEWLLTQFATARIGAILVTINPAYRLAELEHVLNSSGCVALITAQEFKSSNYLDMVLSLIQSSEGAGNLNIRSDRVPALKIVACMATDSDRPCS